MRLRNHLVLAAGVLGTTGASLARQLRNGAGGVVTKSIGPAPMPGHAGPCLVPLEDGLLNAMGLPNPSRAFVDELGAVAGEPVVASIFGGSPEEFAEVGSWFAGSRRRARAEPLLPPRRGLRGRARLRPGARRGVHPGRGRPRPAGLGQADPERHGHRRDRPGRRAGRGLGPRRDQHAPGHADLDRAPPARPRQPLRRALGEGRLPGRGPVRVRALRGRLDPRHRLRRGLVRERRARDADGRRVRRSRSARPCYGDANVFATIAAALYADDGVDPAEIVGCAHA